MCEHCMHFGGGETDQDGFDVAYYDVCCKCGIEEWYDA